MRRAIALSFLVLLIAPDARAQSRAVSPGMSRAQVVAAIGEPLTTRSAKEFSYLFYRNACGRRCGMHDLVILRRDSVVDAIFRSPDRHYTGRSSSPAAIPPQDAARLAPTAGASTPPASVRPIERPVQASDTKPSIPLTGTQVRPAPASPAPVKRNP